MNETHTSFLSPGRSNLPFVNQSYTTPRMSGPTQGVATLLSQRQAQKRSNGDGMSLKLWEEYTAKPGVIAQAEEMTRS
jgi:hypothetical protein